MPSCKDCKFYTPVDEDKGDCFGHEVLADRDVRNCPSKAFQPK